jgi:1-acyl-sn-glycerol-3-phosphate acyltransferase
LALRERVPIIPVVTVGSHEMLIILSDGQWLARWFPPAKWLRAKAWPISLTLPWGLTAIPPLFYIPRRVRFFQEVLEPIRFENDGPEAAEDPDWVENCHRRVLDTMQAGMDRLTTRKKRTEARTSSRQKE